MRALWVFFGIVILLMIMTLVLDVSTPSPPPPPPSPPTRYVSASGQLVRIDSDGTEWVLSEYVYEDGYQLMDHGKIIPTKHVIGERWRKKTP